MYSTSGTAPAASSRSASPPCCVDEVRGVQALGQDQDDRLHREAFDELEGAFGRARPRVVRVEREHHPLREPRREPEVSFAERGPARRHRVRHAGPDHRDHVGIPLDEEELADLVAEAFARCRLYRTSALR